MARQFSPPNTSLAIGHRFNMIEMLIVMSVMLLMLAIGVPSLSGIVKANAVNAGASAVAQHLRLARQYAIARGRYVALVIPTAEGANAGGVEEWSYKASALRLCFLADAPTIRTESGKSWYEGTFDGYVEGSKWQFLPNRVFVGYTDSFGPFETPLPPVGKRSCNTVSGLLFPDITVPTPIDNVRAIIFRPNGAVMPAPSGSHTQMVIMEGTIKGNDELFMVGRNFVACEVNRFTGKVRFID